MSAELQKLYDQIPTFSCKPGCGDCCGPVPFTLDEAAAAGVRHVTVEELAGGMLKALVTGKDACVTCEHRTPVGCSIYAHRPLMCRIYGATEDPGLACPHGCGPLNPLPIARVKTLMDQYIAIQLREAKAVPA